ncbi:MAG: porin [Rubellimicrobium sp.]|nr:porin [Rubellimicrobium sp.]
MKYILLASASAFAFAGAAMADVSFGGDAELGYNDTVGVGDNDGFYWSANLEATLKVELNNGLTAGASVSIELSDDNLSEDMDTSDYVLWLESENAALYFGATDPAAIKHWAGVDGMAADRFTEDATDGEDDLAVLRGDLTWGGIGASVSVLAEAQYDDVDQLSVGASGSFGNFNFSLAYQDYSDWYWPNGDFYDDRVMAVSVGTTFGGADVTLAYAKVDSWVPGAYSFDSIGIQGSYPIGPVTVGAHYVAQDIVAGGVSDGNTWGINVDYASGPIGVSVYYEDYESATPADWGIDASYAVGNGLTVYAGVAGSGDAPYIGGEFDMGNGATLGLSYADDNATHDQGDEIGARDYQEGATAWVSFTF